MSKRLDLELLEARDCPSGIGGQQGHFPPPEQQTIPHEVHARTQPSGGALEPGGEGAKQHSHGGGGPRPSKGNHHHQGGLDRPRHERVSPSRHSLHGEHREHSGQPPRPEQPLRPEPGQSLPTRAPDLLPQSPGQDAVFTAAVRQLAPVGAPPPEFSGTAGLRLAVFPLTTPGVPVPPVPTPRPGGRVAMSLVMEAPESPALTQALPQTPQRVTSAGPPQGELRPLEAPPAYQPLPADSVPSRPVLPPISAPGEGIPDPGMVVHTARPQPVGVPVPVVALPKERPVLITPSAGPVVESALAAPASRLAELATDVFSVGLPVLDLHMREMLAATQQFTETMVAPLEGWSHSQVGLWVLGVTTAAFLWQVRPWGFLTNHTPTPEWEREHAIQNLAKANPLPWEES